MGDEDSPRVEVLFDALSHPRRRAILLLIALSPVEGVRLRTIAETIYAIEHDETPTAAPSRPITNLRSNLIRSHLGQLKACGLITTESSDRLRAGPAFGRALGVIFVAHMEATG